jgi:hypothetical protein
MIHITEHLMNRQRLGPHQSPAQQLNRISGFTAVSAFAVFPLHADYSVEERGAWPESWPKELEPLRKNARTFEDPRQPLLHYGIRFTTRDEFEAAWPSILKVKSKGAPIVLRRGPNFWLGGASHGVCVHTPPADTKPLSGTGRQQFSVGNEQLRRANRGRNGRRPESHFSAPGYSDQRRAV